MKYNGINVSEQEIVAKVLEDQNAWRDFSINCTFSIEEIEKYKDNIIWDFYYKKINSTYYIIENSIIYYFSGFTPLGVKLINF